MYDVAGLIAPRPFCAIATIKREPGPSLGNGLIFSLLSITLCPHTIPKLGASLGIRLNYGVAS